MENTERWSERDGVKEREGGKEIENTIQKKRCTIQQKKR